ncbi:MAG: response regulator transcription factor [Marinobacterium sp.]
MEHGAHPCIAIIEDHADLREELLFYLQEQGYRSWGVDSAEKFWKRLHAWPADIVLVDVGLPGENGFSVVEYLRRLGNFGLIIVSAYGTQEDCARGLALGADAYLVKPIDFSHLASRIELLWEKLQEKVGSNHQQAAERSCWKLDDFNQNLMTPEGKVLKLSQQEFNLLSILINSSHEILSREILHDEIFGAQSELNLHRIDVILSRLRKKARERGIKLPIRSIFGRGMAFIADP